MNYCQIIFYSCSCAWINSFTSLMLQNLNKNRSDWAILDEFFIKYYKCKDLVQDMCICKLLSPVSYMCTENNITCLVRNIKL